MPTKKDIDILKEQVAELILECEKVPVLELECERIDNELEKLKTNLKLTRSKHISLGIIKARFKGG